MTKFEYKVGDRVRVNDTIPKEWWFKPGDIGTIVSVPGGSRMNIEVSFDNKRGRLKLGGVGYVNSSHIELVNPKPESNHVVMLVKDGVYLPAEKPKVLHSERQALHVAKAMAKKHGGTFVVFKAVAEAEMPHTEPTVRTY